MQYRIRVAGKVFEGTDLRTLLRRAVEAKKGEHPVPILRSRVHRFTPPPSPASPF